jgi:hypothetical protein
MAYVMPVMLGAAAGTGRTAHWHALMPAGTALAAAPATAETAADVPPVQPRRLSRRQQR